MEAHDSEDAVDTDSIAGAVEKILGGVPKPGLKGPSVGGFLHHDPKRPVMFGGWFGDARAPLVFMESPSHDLAAYLSSDPQGPFRSPGELDTANAQERWGFRMDRLEGLLKADWHTLPHLGPEAEVFLPRLGRAGQLLRAPPRILAFIVAFRAVNRAPWAAMAKVLRGLGQAFEGRGEAAGRRGLVLRSLAECFANQRHFGAVEAQVWWGNPSKRLPSHKDGAPSLLHLGVTLGGKRTLRAGVFGAHNAEGNRLPLPVNQSAAPLPWKGPGVPEGVVPLNASAFNPSIRFDAKINDPRGQAEKNVWDEAIWRQDHLREVPMVTGSMYLSSPFCFEHAVCYEPCSEREPVIALQFRFGFPEDLGKRLNDLRDREMLSAATVVTEALHAASAAGQLRLPSLQEVMRAEAELRFARPAA